jgi:hypothetical protein
MSEATKNLNSRLSRACDATDKFIREYSDKMRSPVSQLLTIVESSTSEIQLRDLEAMNRVLKDIDQILTHLMEGLEKDGNPEI